MVVIELQGGLGNQMFQYAAAKALSLQRGCPLKISANSLQKNYHDITNSNIFQRIYELQIFKNINDEMAEEDELLQFTRSSITNKVYKKLGLSHYKTYHERHSAYSPEFLNLKPPVLIRGYFQSEYYFEIFKPEIRKYFEFPNPRLDNKSQILLNQIMSTETISIHIRRTDYLMPVINDIHGLCDKSYYFKAINLIRNKYPKAVLYFFSDDQKWVKENFGELYPQSVYIEGNTKANSWKDMYLMSKCNHNIIANSSFSWWAAWLNANPAKMVIAPQRWFKITNKIYDSTTLLPVSWIKL